MRILGGKSRLARDLADVLAVLGEAAGCAEVEDRFCGTLCVAKACEAVGLRPVAAEDGHPALVNLYRAIAAGTFDAPASLTREAWETVARGPRDPADPMTAFAGLFCSWRGKYFAGWQPDDLRWPEGGTGRSAAAKARRDLLALRPLLQRLELRLGDCLGPLARGRLGFFDPPYAGTTGYAGAPPYNPAQGWARLGVLAQRSPVLVTEFEAPAPWIEVARFPVGSPGFTAGKIERLFAAGLSAEVLTAEPWRSQLAALAAARAARLAGTAARYRARKGC